MTISNFSEACFKHAVDICNRVWYKTIMNDKDPTDAIEPKERPPFNEVSVLFPLLSIYTSGYLGLMVADFFLMHSLSLLDGLMTIYIALLGAYAADKEIRRWMGTPEPPRKGSIFVYIWTLFALMAFIVHSFRPEYVLPANLVTVCLQVLGIFFGSKASKYVYEKRSGSGEFDPGREKLVLDMIAAKGQVTRQMAVEELNVSRATAGRLLAGLEIRGLIVRKGEGKGVYYVTATHSAPDK